LGQSHRSSSFAGRVVAFLDIISSEEGTRAMSHEVIIETRNLTKVYHDFWGRPKVQALKALDLQVHRGEIFGLLGPNGSGKTTTIKLLLGLVFATEGEALIFNEPTTNVAKNERIGYLPEESYLYKFLNAEETLHFYGRLFKMSSAERKKRVGRLIDMVGLTGAKHRQLREYSKGMQRRIGLAQALINNPELILLDEPTSGLDPIGTSEIKQLIRELREQGKTVVLSGHLLADMQDICDRIAILHRGELKEIGRVSDLLTVQDVTQIKVRNLSPEAIDELRDVIHRHRGEDLTIDHPTTTLEELFLRIVQESDLHPGRRKVAQDMARPAETNVLAGTRSKS
jgi:ABC-2 type transport system ATP-binding protein